MYMKTPPTVNLVGVFAGCCELFASFGCCLPWRGTGRAVLWCLHQLTKSSETSPRLFLTWKSRVLTTVAWQRWDYHGRMLSASLLLCARLQVIPPKEWRPASNYDKVGEFKIDTPVTQFVNGQQGKSKERIHSSTSLCACLQASTSCTTYRRSL